MILLLLVAAWMLLVLVAAGLCMAAHAGDLGLLEQASADALEQNAPSRARADGLEIAACSNVERSHPFVPGAVLERRDGVAA